MDARMWMSNDGFCVLQHFWLFLVFTIKGELFSLVADVLVNTAMFKLEGIDQIVVLLSH